MQPLFETFFTGAELIGTIAFAATGAMIAIDRSLDLFGVLFLGIINAVGGGILRDLLLGVLPPGAFRVPTYLAVSAATALIAFLFTWWYRRTGRHSLPAVQWLVNLLDAIGLGAFAVLGVELSINQGHGNSLFLCTFMGMTTAVGGGILRDVLSSSIPSVLKERIYAVAAILGSLLYFTLRVMAVSTPTATLVSMLVTVLIRMISSRFHWHLPSLPPHQS